MDLSNLVADVVVPVLNLVLNTNEKPKQRIIAAVLLVLGALSSMSGRPDVTIIYVQDPVCMVEAEHGQEVGSKP